MAQQTSANKRTKRGSHKRDSTPILWTAPVKDVIPERVDLIGLTVYGASILSR
jgi:hypothetical protein